MSTPGRWRTDKRGELPCFFAERESMLFLIPIHISSTQCRGPLKLKVSGKCPFNFQRLLSLDIEQNDGARFVDRNTERLSHTKRIPRIHDRRGLGAYGQRSGKAFSG